MHYIYISTAHETKIDKCFIDIAAFFTSRREADMNAYRRSLNAYRRSLKGSFQYYAVWKVAIDRAWHNYPDLLTVYKDGETIDIKQFNEVL